jgi:hypothetical protein
MTTASTNQNCCLPNCINVTTNCKDCPIDTNCYINYDPLIANLRKIFKSYEDRAKNVKYEYLSVDDDNRCNRPTLRSTCSVLPKYYQDYKILAAGYSTYGGCPKKSLLKFYNAEKINNLFAENYVVEQYNSSGDQIIRKIICEDFCPFRLCQPSNIPAGSRYRIFFVFAYKYDLCDTIYCDNKPWKLDIYVADLPSINCLPNDICKVPNLHLQFVNSMDTENMDSVSDVEPQCVLCRQPVENPGSPTTPINDTDAGTQTITQRQIDLENIRLVMPLLSKYAL